MQRSERLRQPIKVLVIEDDTENFRFVRSILEEEHYTIVSIVTDISNLGMLYDANTPDLIISEISIKERNVFDVLLQNKFLETPVLFITGFIEERVFDLANKHPRSLFLAKPFHQYTLVSSVNLLLSAYPPKSNNFIEVINKNQRVLKLNFNEVLFIEADGNYTYVHTISNKVFVRKKTLKQFKKELNDTFLQINKSSIINGAYIKRLELGRGILLLAEKEFKIGRTYRSELDAFLRRHA